MDITRATSLASFAGPATLGVGATFTPPLGLVAAKAAQIAGAKLAGVVMDSNASAARTFASEPDAKAAFQRQARALFDVNSWTKLSGYENAKFELRDGEGRETTRKFAQVGDFVRIRLFAQPTADWVRIESAQVTADRASIVVRPSYNPTEQPLRPEITVHFFTKDATNTFSVERRGATVVAAVRGRNERANMGAEASGSLSRGRNGVAAAGAWGVSLTGTKTTSMQQHQWNVFTERLLGR